VSFDPDNPMLMVKTALELSPTEWKQYPLPQQSITPEVQARWNKAWELIPELARMLRDEFGATKIKVFGSAISVDYFSDGSDIDIAAWDIPIAQYLSAVLAVNEFHEDFKVDLLDPSLCRVVLRQKIEKEGIEV
jgi:uncharacterized protein